MRVLVITGDRAFGPGHPRFELQRSVVDELAVLYWGKESLWPKVPPGHFDVVTAQDPFWRGHFGWHLARRIGARFNIQVHTDLDAQSWLRHVFAQIQLRHADTVRAVSEKIKQQVLRVAPKAKVSVLPIFVDIAPFQNLQHEPQAQKTILWVGRFEDEKDPLLALEIFKDIHAHMNAKLVMLGSGSLSGVLRAAAGNLPVTFPGWQNPATYLVEADVVLCTSKHESYGASIIEALAARVPVVAPDVGLAKEAGAIIAARSNLAEKVIEVLQSGTRGELKLLLPTAQKWAEEWLKTLKP